MTSAHILVIDDENAVRKVVCDNLSLCGFRVSSASGGQQGLDMIDPSGPPALVITDILMPGMSGLEVISAIRSQFPAIRVIAVSGGGRVGENNDLLEKAADLGASAVLAKPLDLDELEKAVYNLLGQHDSQ